MASDRTGRTVLRTSVSHGSPQGITYFVEGASGKLARGDLRDKSPLMARGFDADLSFMVVNIDEDLLTFQTISRTGTVIDSGSIERRTGE